MKKIILTTEQLDKITEWVSADTSEDQDLGETISSANSNNYEMECDVDLDYYGVTYMGNEIDNIDTSSVKVIFGIDMEHRSWGIKGAYVSVIDGSETLSLSIDYYPEEGDDHVNKEIEIPINWDSANEESDDSLGYIGISQVVDVKLANNNEGDIVVESVTVYVKSI
jgi:hypothetical protein